MIAKEKRTMYYDQVIFHKTTKQYMLCNDYKLVHLFCPQEQKIKETMLGSYSALFNLLKINVGEICLNFSTLGVRVNIYDLQGNNDHYYIKYDEDE